MIVNVNPFDTGYDENSNVMKFAALAREVYVTPASAPARRIPATGPPSPTKAKSRPVNQITETKTAPQRRKVTISVDGRERKMSEAVVEILEGESFSLSGSHVVTIYQRMSQTIKTMEIVMSSP
jgi:kinesin family protein 20